MTPKFNVGDSVRLRSGGPWMTISRVTERKDDCGPEYYCLWFVGGTLTGSHFVEGTLVAPGGEEKKVYSAPKKVPRAHVKPRKERS